MLGTIFRGFLVLKGLRIALGVYVGLTSSIVTLQIRMMGRSEAIRIKNLGSTLLLTGVLLGACVLLSGCMNPNDPDAQTHCLIPSMCLDIAGNRGNGPGFWGTGTVQRLQQQQQHEEYAKESAACKQQFPDPVKQAVARNQCFSDSLWRIAPHDPLTPLSTATRMELAERVQNGSMTVAQAGAEYAPDHV